jgi:uncharacterized RDD family membrane protein YckC
MLSPVSDKRGDLEYVGFWARVVASSIDLIVQLLVVVPLTILAYGEFASPDGRMFRGPLDVLINAVLPAVAFITLWRVFGTTPGKLAMSARIVDADTGEALKTGQAVLRYFGLILAMIPLGLGLLWIGLDRRKQGWHDRIAGTVVVRPKGKEPVRFDGAPGRT